MKKNFKVSIIMNCHNGEQFLLDSLKSILSQTYKNWELIFFDNFSNDYSKKIFFSFKDKRFKYFYSNKLLNLYHARNIAIQKSKGQLISFLDTDDIWLKKKLEYQIKEIQKKKNRLFIFKFLYKKK